MEEQRTAAALGGALPSGPRSQAAVKTRKTNSFSPSEVANRAVFLGCMDRPEPRSTAAFPFLTRTDTTHWIPVHEQCQQRRVKTGTTSLLFWGGASPTCTCSKMPGYRSSTASTAAVRTVQLLSPPLHPAAATALCAGPAADSSTLSLIQGSQAGLGTSEERADVGYPCGGQPSRWPIAGGAGRAPSSQPQSLAGG